MASTEITVDIKISQLEPTSTYIEEMELLVGYLRTKSNPSELDRRIINTFENWLDELFDGFGNFNDKPSLELLKGGKT